jgi:hypothetical protein
MDLHILGALGGPLDFNHALIALMLGVAGGFFLAELRIEPLKRALRRVTARRPQGEDPWR